MVAQISIQSHIAHNITPTPFQCAAVYLVNMVDEELAIKYPVTGLGYL